MIAGGRLDAVLDEAAARHGQRTALVDGEVRLSYAELLAGADAIAGWLGECGVAPDAVVGVLMPAGAMAVLGCLAVTRAGAAYLPLDPVMPDDRLAYMLAAVDSTYVLAPDQAAVPPELTATVIPIGTEPGQWLDRRRAPGRHAPGADALAYVIYTSGSTGRPKAVGVEHHAARKHLGASSDAFAVTHDDCIMQLHSLSFDASFEEVWTTFACGATLVCPQGSLLDIANVFAQVQAHGVTCLHMVTSYWRALIAELLDGEPAAPLRSLRLIDIGGEAASLEDLAAWRAAGLSHVELLNGYGPTEAVVTVTAYHLPARASPPVDARSIPIGTPLRHRKVYLLDEHMSQVSDGEVGEIFVGGDCLARGYLNDPELTRQRFIPDPFARRTGARMYRTGDLARATISGALEFLGRTDDQVQVRGHRVELGEVNSALRRLPGVLHAAVIPHETGRALVAAVVVDGIRPLTGSDLRSALQNVLPAYMVPTAIAVVPNLPILPTNSKLDRQGLRRLIDEVTGVTASG